MLNSRQFISLLLVSTLVITTAGLDACSKKSSESGKAAEQGQAPPTTYATPTADQLSQLVAPIALFPDNLLAQVLAGSTYPDQITAAYQWLQSNTSLKGAQLMQAVDQESWDASVKGLTQFPDVLQQMASNLSWTSALGDAYYNVPQSVMNAVQVMRQRAYDAGNLKSNQQQNISVEKQPAGAESAPAPAPASSGEPQVTVVQAPPQTIVIQPAQPEVVYVPTYNPTAVYGAPVPAYPGYSTGAMVATSLLSFGVGVAVGAAMSGGGCCGWGYNSWGASWHNSTVVYNHNTYISNSNTFVNRNNYYNRNVNANLNNVNANNINRNNLNANNINRNNINANNVNRGQLNNANNRTNNFNNGNTPQFNQQRNQQQFKSENRGNLGEQRGAGQSNLGQQNRGGLQAGNRPSNQPIQAADRQTDRGVGQQGNRNAGNNAFGNGNQSQRQAERGFGEQANRGSGNTAFSNYNQGGNTRTNSARGQQSLESRSGGTSGDRSAARSGGGGSGGHSSGRAAGGGGGGGRRR